MAVSFKGAHFPKEAGDIPWCLQVSGSSFVTGSRHQPNPTSQPAQRRLFYTLAGVQTRAGPFSCFVVPPGGMTALSQICICGALWYGLSP